MEGAIPLSPFAAIFRILATWGDALPLRQLLGFLRWNTHVCMMGEDGKRKFGCCPSGRNADWDDGKSSGLNHPEGISPGGVGGDLGNARATPVRQASCMVVPVRSSQSLFRNA